MIVGSVDVPNLVDKRQVRKLLIEGAGCLFRSGATASLARAGVSNQDIDRHEARAGRRLIDVHNPDDVAAIGSDITEIQGEAVGDNSLQTDSPSSDPG